MTTTETEIQTEIKKSNIRLETIQRAMAEARSAISRNTSLIEEIEAGAPSIMAEFFLSLANGENPPVPTHSGQIPKIQESARQAALALPVLEGMETEAKADIGRLEEEVCRVAAMQEYEDAKAALRERFDPIGFQRLRTPLTRIGRHGDHWKDYQRFCDELEATNPKTISRLDR